MKVILFINIQLSTRSLTTRANHIWIELKQGMMNLICVQVQSGGQMWFMIDVDCHQNVGTTCMLQADLYTQLLSLFWCVTWVPTPHKIHPSDIFLKQLSQNFLLRAESRGCINPALSIILSISDIFLKKARTAYFNTAASINKTNPFSPGKCSISLCLLHGSLIP